jgi:N-hydroxyarylamine O-acetyltransferase
MNIDGYLKRIDYTGPLTPSAGTLRELQVAHLRTVPFENLSIHAGEPIVLENDHLFTKIVDNKRGGFCYELNGLFAALLSALGFEVAMLAAGVAKAPRSSASSRPLAITELTEDDFGPVFDHMALLVNLDQRWLVDVGFGDSFLEPLLLDESGEQVQGTQTFRIVKDNQHRIILRRNNDEDWKPQYRFTLQPHTYAEYEEMCHYHQTSPDSHFTKARICSRATEEGRITLSDMRLITTSGAPPIRQEQTLTSEYEYVSVLRDQFGIVMSK